MLVTGLERVAEDGESLCNSLEGHAELEVFTGTIPHLDRAVDHRDDRADAADHFEARHFRTSQHARQREDHKSRVQYGDPHGVRIPCKRSLAK